MPIDNTIVAISFLTKEEVRVLGSSLKLVFPLPSDGSFDDLLNQLDREGERRRASAHPPE